MDARKLSRRNALMTAGAALVSAAALPLLSACSASAPAAAPTASAPTAVTNGAAPTSAPAAKSQTQGKQTQVTYTARIGVQADHFNAFGKKFMEKYPNIKYVPQMVPGAEWAQKIQIQAAGGTLADAIWMPSIGLFGEFSHKSLIIPLDSYVKGQNFDLSVYYKNAVDALTRNGKLFGIPWICHPGRTGLYYSKALFDDAQVKPPDEKWTYQDLASGAKSVTKASGGKTDQFGYLPGSDMWSYIIPIRGYGGDYLSPDGKKVTIDSPEAGKAIQEAYADLIGNLKVAPTPDLIQGGSAQMFASKKLAMFQSGYWGISSMLQYAKDLPWAVVPMPKQANGKLGMFEVDTNAVTKFAKDPESAFLFCAFMGSKEAGIDIAKRGSVPGARPDVWQSPELTSSAAHVVFSKILADAPGLLLPANYRETELADAFQKGFDPITIGKETDAAKVIKSVLPSLQAIVDKQPA